MKTNYTIAGIIAGINFRIDGKRHTFIYEINGSDAHLKVLANYKIVGLYGEKQLGRSNQIFFQNALIASFKEDGLYWVVSILESQQSSKGYSPSPIMYADRDLLQEIERYTDLRVKDSCPLSKVENEILSAVKKFYSK